MKVKVNPAGCLVRVCGEDGRSRQVRIEQSPYYQFALDGKIWPLMRYTEECVAPNSEIAFANITWARALLDLIKTYGYSPKDVHDWPILMGRLVRDGHKRVAFCAALKIRQIEVENTLQERYQQWNQAFPVGDGWLEITSPPDWRQRPDLREECYEAWEAIQQRVDFKGKSVVDLGCAQGFYCHRASDAFASQVVGIDRDKKIAQISNPGLPKQDIIDQAIQVAWLCNYQNIDYRVADLATWKPTQLWDIVLALRIHYHFGRQQRDFLIRASKAAKEALVLQTNLAHRGELSQYTAWAYSKAVLRHLWRDMEVVPLGKMPLMICKGRRAL